MNRRPCNPWLLAGLLSALVFGSAAGRTWLVPAEVATIQAAIDSAADGDTVAVGPGTFHERLNVVGKNLVLTSTDGPDSTFISGALLSGDLRPILVLDRVDSTTLITGFTFQDNGMDSSRYTYGGAIETRGYDQPCTARIRGNVFRRNFAEYGGGMLIGFSELGAPGPLVEENTFEDNTAFFSGGAIFIATANGARIVRNIFARNTAMSVQGLGLGGAIGSWVLWEDTVRVIQNTFYRNRGGYGSGICADCGVLLADGNSFVFNETTRPEAFAGTINLINEAVGVVSNNILVLAVDGWGVGTASGSSVTLDCNDFWLNERGDHFNGPVGGTNLLLDPQLCDPYEGDLHLGPASPCLPENSGGCGLIGALGVGCQEIAGVPERAPAADRLGLSVRRTAGGGMYLHLDTPGRLAGHASDVGVFDVQGRQVWSLRDEGSAEVRAYTWDGNSMAGKRVASGVYFVRCRVGPAVASERFVLLRY